MADLLMYIPNEDTQNYPFCRLQLVIKTVELNTQLYEPKNQNLIKVPKFSSQRRRNRYYKVPKVVKPTDDCVINSLLSPLSLFVDTLD